MNEALLNYISRRRLDRDYIQRKCKLSSNSFALPLMNFTWQSWRQIRIINPQPGKLKSISETWSRGCYFLNSWDKEKDEILIVEWEIDFLSIIPYATNYNLIWLKWVNNLPRCIREIEWLNKVYDVYILVDNDAAANKAIDKVAYTPLHLYDVRGALSWYKDVNEAICNDALDMSALPKRIIKLKPLPKRKFTRYDTLDTIEKIDALPAIDVLERLFPEYQRRWQWCIAENWKKTHWYKFSTIKNIVTDFSEKGRPEWGAYNIAKAKFKEPKLVFEYFKGLIK